MPKVTILKGLPGSGKSTLAMQMVADGKGRVKRVNRDSLRAMIDNDEFHKDSEYIIIKLRNFLITQFTRKGYDVVVDDTNLHPRNERDIRKLVGGSVDVEVVVLDTPLAECLKRNAGREKFVPEKVIVEMAKNWDVWKDMELNGIVVEELVPATFNVNLPQAIMCDLDGTLCHMSGRSPFEWHRVGEDTLDHNVAFALQLYKAQGYVIIFMSGRDSVCRPETEAWLDRHHIKYDYLWMRAESDQRKDSIVKVELFDAHVRGVFNVVQVLDDRDQVVDVWRELGLVCWQVAAGAF